MLLSTHFREAHNVSTWEEIVKEHGPALFGIAARILGYTGTIVESRSLEPRADRVAGRVLRGRRSLEDLEVTLDLRQVKPGQRQGDLTVIMEGVNPAENVVTSGQLQLSPGAKVLAKEAEPSGSGAKPSVNKAFN